MEEIDSSNPLAVELLAERASAYFATVRKMEAALAALASFDADPSPDKRSESRESLLADAAELSFFFVIQREAMRLPHYPELYQEFGISDEVRARMGPKLN